MSKKIIAVCAIGVFMLAVFVIASQAVFDTQAEHARRERLLQLQH